MSGNLFMIFGVYLLPFLCSGFDILPEDVKAILPGLKEYCLTKSCVDYTNTLKANMNFSVDPCVDFYQYSCGKYISNNVIPDDKSTIDSFDTITQKVQKNLIGLLSSNVQSTDDNWSKNAKNFYASCINLDRVNSFTQTYALKVLNDEFGGWPLISGYSNPNSPLDLLKRINKYGLIDIVVITISPNPKDSNRNIIKIQQAPGIPYEYYLSDEYIQAFKNYTKTIAGYLNPNRQIVEKDIDDIINFDKSLSQIRLSISEQKNSSQNIEMKLSELQQKIPDFPWVDFITNGLFLNISDIKVNQSELVSVDDWDYLIEMQKIYSNYSKNYPQVLINYLLASFFMGKMNDNLPIKYLQAKLEFDKLTSGVNELSDRSEFCITKGQSYLPNELGKIYVNKYFPKKAKTDVLEITNNLLNEMKIMIQESTWMDAQSKTKAIEKANYIKPQIGYPDFYDNASYVAQNYNYEMDERNLLKNILTAIEYSQRVALGNLRKNVDKSLWPFSASYTEALYSPSNNQIYFPAAILITPFYDDSLPKYLNYGGIGSVIGHEITHGFDDTGRRYDKNGRYYSDNEQGLWTQQTVDAFKNKTICMIDEYSGYNVTQINQNINGVQTLGENIADNGGIKMSYKAYQKWALKNIFFPELPIIGINLTANQLFFVNMAQVWCSKSKTEPLLNFVLSDEHSPPEFRVKGMTQNSEAFQKAFNCKKPTKMCSIW